MEDTVGIPQNDRVVVQRKNGLFGPIQKAFPRLCVKLTIAILGVLVVIFGILGVVRAGASFFFPVGDLFDIIFGIIEFPVILVGACCFIASSVMRKSRPQMDRVLSIIAVICFSILCFLGVCAALAKVIDVLVFAATVDQDDLDKMKEQNPNVSDDVTLSSYRNSVVIGTLIISGLTCCCCLVCCLPCLMMSYINCAWTFPQGHSQGDGEDDDVYNTRANTIEIPETGGFGELLDEDEGMIPDDVDSQLDTGTTNINTNTMTPHPQDPMGGGSVKPIEPVVVPDQQTIEYSSSINNNDGEELDDNITFRN